MIQKGKISNGVKSVAIEIYYLLLTIYYYFSL